MRTLRHLNHADQTNYWPGFVDALSSVLLVILFTLMVFIVGQFYLGIKVNDQEINLTAHSKALTHERQFRMNLMTKLQSAHMTHANLKNELELSLGREQSLADALEKSQTQFKDSQLNNQALQENIDTLTADKQTLNSELEEIRINYAQAAQLVNMAKHRSLFLTQVSKAFAKISGFRQQGDRFVCDSSLLFDIGSATLTSEGLAQIQKVAETVKTLQTHLPKDLNWMLRIDGHTDAVPIHNEKFQSNWELSVARAMAVVKALQNYGIPSHRLAAAGFGEHHPVRKGASMAENRRIEIRFDTL